MNLVKEKWEKSDGEEFQKYLISLSGTTEQKEREKRIINTSLPCLAIGNKTVKGMISEIKKGNFISFLALWLWDYIANTYINGSLICNIKDFATMTKYLDKYVEWADNWATIDSLIIKFNDENESQAFALCEKYLKSDKPFVKRAGLTLIFKFINDKYIDKIFEYMNSFENETHYYVNMANAWLFCECFIKQREKTIEFLKTHKLNKFTINKGICKCRDSFRVSDKDKEMLLKYRKK